MALQQVNQSFQDDGNFSLLDLEHSSSDGPRMRIEMCRASHSDKRTNRATAAGTPIWVLCGSDHLKSESNRIFRHIFSVEIPKKKEMLITLELREKFQEDGSWEVKIRDLDYRSASYGTVVVCIATPMKGAQSGTYELAYEVYDPKINTGVMLTSPIISVIPLLDRRLEDIEEKNDRLGVLQIRHVIYVNLHNTQHEIDELLKPLTTIFHDERYAAFAYNVDLYQRFSDFQGKCSHTGEYLMGDYVQQAAKYLGFFTSSACMILFGKPFVKNTEGRSKAFFSLWNQETPLAYATKPGMYQFFILAHIANMEIYQLLLDKVYSDYGGIPMKRQRGSMLENGRKPVKSAYLANQTLAEIAVALYEPHFSNRLK